MKVMGEEVRSPVLPSQAERGLLFSCSDPA